MNDIALGMTTCSAQSAQPYKAVLSVFRYLELGGCLVGVEPESSNAAGLEDHVPLTPHMLSRAVSSTVPFQTPKPQKERDSNNVLKLLN